MVEIVKEAFKSIIVGDVNGEELRINEGDKVRFCTETGELITGALLKISGKKEKTKLQIRPYGSQKEEIWSFEVMSSGSLTLDEE